MPVSTEKPTLSPTLERLSALGQRRHYAKGVLLIQEGDVGETLFVVLDGAVRAFSVDDTGKEITYATYGANQYFGEMSLDGGLRSASVITTEPTTCAVIAREAVRNFMADDPGFASELLNTVIQRARAATESARRLALQDVYGRLATFLNQQSATTEADGSRLLTTRMTHGEIANHIGCSREMVSRLMRDLEVGGFMAVVANHIKLLRSLPSRW
jgi:CRP/FNR family transcriptional regulator, cyclic AMP receptor protein